MLVVMRTVRCFVQPRHPGKNNTAGYWMDGGWWKASAEDEATFVNIIRSDARYYL